ncbi:MAG: sodium:alanine symporter family protein [Coriobacteriales bacterium]|jgi:AGCS family alanine or glycine:cation symporter
MDFASVVTGIDNFLWGLPMIVLLLGSHLFFTVRTRCIQRRLPQALKITFSKDPHSPGDISQFGALTTALSSTIGTGNIVGVGTAIMAGGPGAVLWMWLTGVFGMATKYSETFMAVKYRVKDHKGEMLGGAMYAWERGFKRKDGTTPWWAKLGAVLFALFVVIATFGTGCATQANALVGVISSNISNPPAHLNWIIGLAVAFLVSLVIFGGIKWLSRICEKIVPFMAIAYVVCCVIILIMNGHYVWDAVVLIVKSAFTPQAGFGGLAGAGMAKAIQFGCARGLYSNESGMGTAPIVASAASTSNPARQALVSMTGTFWDTVVICLLTGLVIVSTLCGNPEVLSDGSITAGAQLTSLAFRSVPVIGTPVLVGGMILFSFTTIIGWSYYGNRCVAYLFGKNAIRIYQVIYVFVAIVGAVGVSDTVWTISDIGNALMVTPNIICLLLLSPMVARETKHYVWDGHIDEKDETPIPTYEDK